MDNQQQIDQCYSSLHRLPCQERLKTERFIFLFTFILPVLGKSSLSITREFIMTTSVESIINTTEIKEI